jgi:hypothetical protein
MIHLNSKNRNIIIMVEESELFQKLITYNSDDYLPTLRIKNNMYSFSNQISTYELLNKICSSYRKKCNMYSNPRHHTEDDYFDTTLFNLYEILKTNNEYGTYADNNNWSPIFDDNQLKHFVSLVHQKFNDCVQYYSVHDTNESPPPPLTP